LRDIIERPDDITAFLGLYWAGGKTPLANQVKKGIGSAFHKFNEYQLAKYCHRGETIKLRDAMILTHPKPTTLEEGVLWGKLVQDTLTPPKTWEVMLSTGGDKKTVFTELLQEKQLGGLALLRNLRNMTESGVDDALIAEAIMTHKFSKVFPYQFVVANEYCHHYDELEQAMLRTIAEEDKLAGETVLLVDVSGSMNRPLSSRSEASRLLAASSVAVIARELAERVAVYSFSSKTCRVSNSRGFKLIDDISTSQQHSSTYLGRAVQVVSEQHPQATRLIIITDEQSDDKVAFPAKVFDNIYVVNVASYQNGVSYKDNVVHIDGFSENVVRYITQFEGMEGE
jgi:hypothetical protein